MKKDKVLAIRLSATEHAAVQAACKKRALDMSLVVRDLVFAAIPYMETRCPPGRWIAPCLVPYAACETTCVKSMAKGKSAPLKGKSRR